ncbi:glycosyl hydrolase family 8 [Labrys monachus]|uniref:glycosyl hydrolase family 8 n=1 Tax=Labrys monachus TaxID=217067 RepID=UPI003521D114
MRGIAPFLAAIAMAVMPAGPGRAAPLSQSARPGTLTTRQWLPWRDRFVTLDGRVVDNANKNVSHSEGQGYGLLLAVLAEDREAFTRIWTFTRSELLLRDDGLAVWRWDPNSNPHVADINDASDGDVLIAYSLALAGSFWKVPAWSEMAREMATVIGEKLVRRVGDRTVLLPGVEGFGAEDRSDGPVVNLSYWIFEAMPVLAHLAPGTNWDELSADGRSLVEEARFGPSKLPADWISLRGAKPAPAIGFNAQFGYDAIRIPLYLLRAGITDKGLLAPFSRAWEQEDGAPAVIALADGRAIEALNDPGYRMVAAALRCALDHRPIPASLREPTLDLYYPSTLYLLALSAVAQRFPECL